MKTVVSVNEISEFEIKPKVELSQWKTLVVEEASSRWQKRDGWDNIVCPLCNSKESTPAFHKSGFSYVECDECKSLFVEQRPDSKELNWWYTQSKSSEFWRDTILKLSAPSRNAKIIEPRAQWIMDGISEYMPNRHPSEIRYTDISFFGKMLIDKVAEISPNMHITSGGITSKNEIYLSPEVNVQTLTSIDELSTLGSTDIVVAIDVLDRIPNFNSLLNQLDGILNAGGLFFATCPVSSGFEIQSLWDKSPTILPPDKLNLFSIKGLLSVLSAHSKWEVLELSTPGMFDIELIKQQLSNSPKNQWPRALHALLDGINNQGIGLFTEYLQSQRLSSFARIVLRKQNDKIF